MSKLDDILAAQDKSNKLNNMDRAIIRGMTYSINKLCELRAEVENRVNQRCKIISKLDDEAAEYKM